MNCFKWTWWRFAEGYNKGGMTSNGQGIWMSIFGTKYYFLTEPGHKFCSQCSRTTPAPADPYELPVCGHCNDV